MRNEIQMFAALLEEPGNLARQALRDLPMLTLEEQIWCSNYQSENPACPEKVKKWLNSDFKRRFNK